MSDLCTAHAAERKRAETYIVGHAVGLALSAVGLVLSILALVVDGPSLTLRVVVAIGLTAVAVSTTGLLLNLRWARANSYEAAACAACRKVSGGERHG